MLLPVAVRLRRGGEWLADGDVPRHLADALATPGLTAEVRLLPALLAAAG